MKNLHIFSNALLLIPFSFSLTGNSQNVAINATGNQADPSAMLDVSSQTAGVLIPRMSTTARNAISSPATGLQIYNTDCGELNYWNGTCWLSFGSLPAPGAITSNSSTALCASVTATYSIASVTGATGYVWILPAGATINSGQGTTSISVTWGNYSGQVCVRAYDACESSDIAFLNVNISPIPATPGNITGLATVSPGQSSVSYFIASVSGASVYNWAVPSGATIATGVGTPAITVNYPCNAVSGNVSVTAGSNCGNSSPASLAITVTSYLSANAGSAVFGGAAIGGSPAASGGYAPYNYSWSPNSNLSSATVANPTALCSGSTTIYTLTVTDAGGCTATSSVTVTRNLSASAGSAVFGGGILSGTATGGASPYAYSWTPNSNLSSYTVANPTALCSGSTTTYSVTVSDANGCSATSSVAVTRNLAANAGSAIFGGATLSGSATGGVAPYTYSWIPNSNLSSYNVANPTAQCGGSTTAYTLTVNDANGCSATSSVTVTRNLTANAGTNITVCPSTSNTIGGSPTASGGNSGSYSYSWNPATNLSSTTIANPTASPASTTTYSVTIMDANGCTATSSMSVTISGSVSHGSQTFSYSGSIVNFTIGTCISSLTIQAYGAQGGTGSSTGAGGLGARMQGVFSVTPGTVLKILVGQQPTSSYSNSGSGGGGTFVTDNNNNPYIIAGGGGGGSYSSVAGQPGLTGTSGGAGSPSGAPGGTSGSGGAYGGSGSSGWASGGGGLTGNGGNQASGSAGANGGGEAFVNGGAGGWGYYNGSSSPGGFGGGGGNGNYGGGGGGGYSGGGPGSSNGNGGGGGGSYNGGTNQVNSSGSQSSNGQVIITY